MSASTETAPTPKKPKADAALNLWQRIAAVMADVEYLNKDKQVGDGGFSYNAVSEESVTGTVREKMIKHGLVIFPVEQVHTYAESQRIDKYGKPNLLCLTTVDVRYKLVNVDNPAEFEYICSSGTGVDSQDKGVGKAQTYAYKYALLRTFGIPTGNDPDLVHNDDLEARAPAAAPGAPEKQLADDATKNELRALVRQVLEGGPNTYADDALAKLHTMSQDKALGGIAFFQKELNRLKPL